MLHKTRRAVLVGFALVALFLISGPAIAEKTLEPQDPSVSDLTRVLERVWSWIGLGDAEEDHEPEGPIPDRPAAESTADGQNEISPFIDPDG